MKKFLGNEETDTIISYYYNKSTKLQVSFKFKCLEFIFKKMNYDYLNEVFIEIFCDPMLIQNIFMEKRR